jgi:hypothetical protein
MNYAEPEFLESHARHLPDAVLIVDNENLNGSCARHFNLLLKAAASLVAADHTST